MQLTWPFQAVPSCALWVRLCGAETSDFTALNSHAVLVIPWLVKALIQVQAGSYLGENDILL